MLNNFRTTQLTWDKATKNIYEKLKANASDENGRKLAVKIVNDGVEEDLSGATLSLYWETRNNSHDGLDAFTAIDASKGEFEIYYTTGMLSNVGKLNACLVLVDSVGRVVSDLFEISVTRGINNEAIESENSFTALTQALVNVSNLETNYAPRLNDLTAQLQQTNAQFANAVANVTVDSEVITARTTKEGINKKTIGTRIDEIEKTVYPVGRTELENVIYQLSRQNPRTITGVTQGVPGFGELPGGTLQAGTYFIMYEYKVLTADTTEDKQITPQFKTASDNTLHGIVSTHAFEDGVLYRNGTIKALSASEVASPIYFLFTIANLKSDHSYTIYTPNFTMVKIDSISEDVDSLMNLFGGAEKQSAVFSNQEGAFSGDLFADKTITANKLTDTAIYEIADLANSANLKNVIDCWGDSLTWGAGNGTTYPGTYPGRLKYILGADWAINNFGVGGERTKTIAARQGGTNLVVKAGVTIPAGTTPVPIEIVSDDDDYIQLRWTDGKGVNPCTIDGIEGNISLADTTLIPSFTRLVAGTEKVITRKTTIITSGHSRKGNINIIWMGQNGMHADGGWSDDADLVNQHKKMINHAETDRYILIGLHTGDLAYRESLETAMFGEFGRHYINLRKYLTTPIYDVDGTTIIDCYGLDDAGLTPTADDLAKIAVGATPLQLLSDGTHGTLVFYEIVGNLVYKRGQELGYWD